MKRLLLSTACLSVFAASLSAQITLNQSSYTSTFVGTQDTLLNSITSSTYPTLTAATNATWDMSGAVSNISSAISILAHVQPASAFSGAQYADSSTFAFGPAGYTANVQYNIASAGLQELGEHVFRNATHLTGAGTSATDSVIVDAQDITYSSAHTVIKFPATMNTNWSSTYHYDFDFHLDFAGAGLSNQLGIVRNYITETDTVIGWGKMKVLMVDGSTSALMDVLQVKTTYNVTDSFFLPGQPSFILSALLGQFGLTQGQTTISYTQSYYQANEVSALAFVDYTDSTYTTPASATTYAARGTTPASVVLVNNDNSVNVYPNPVTNRQVSLDINQAKNGMCTYEVIDISGKLLTSDVFMVTGNQIHQQIQLPSNVSAGMYYIRVKMNNNTIAVKPISITN